jgi:hypothetical protein
MVLLIAATMLIRPQIFAPFLGNTPSHVPFTQDFVQQSPLVEHFWFAPLQAAQGIQL